VKKGRTIFLRLPMKSSSRPEAALIFFRNGVSTLGPLQKSVRSRSRMLRRLRPRQLPHSMKASSVSASIDSARRKNIICERWRSSALVPIVQVILQPFSRNQQIHSGHFVRV
jgi:hypothetical protein